MEKLESQPYRTELNKSSEGPEIHAPDGIVRSEYSVRRQRLGKFSSIFAGLALLGEFTGLTTVCFFFTKWLLAILTAANPLHYPNITEFSLAEKIFIWPIKIFMLQLEHRMITYGAAIAGAILFNYGYFAVRELIIKKFGEYKNGTN